MKRDVTVFGAGYVGLVTGACLASSGHRVTVLEIDERKLRSLCEGTPPFFEPGLAELLTAGLAAGDLRFEDAHAPRLAGLGEFVFVAVGTPSSAGGAADLRFVRSVMDQIAEQAHPGTVVIMKSTVPPGTGARLAEELVACGVDYVSNPEFLREGAAVTDWFETDRIVLGGKAESVAAVASLYADIDAPVVECDIPSAELIKYASNAFLATKISFANEIARLCDHIGADVTTVTEGVGLDRRIGPAFLNAGIGYGGSCFPKDTRALDFQASMNGYEFNLLKAVIDVNRRQRLLPVIELRAQLSDLVGAPVAVLGLTFKPNTDDVRESPAEEIIGMLLAEGASVTAYDPVGRLALTADGYRQTDTIAEALDGVRAVVITTEWPEFLTAHWPELVSGMADPRLVFDGRNCLDPAALLAAGARYVGVGRR